MVWDSDGLLVPPLVTTLCPGDGVSGPLEDENVLDDGAALEGGIDDGLGGDSLSTSSAFIGGDQNTGPAIQDTVSKRFGGETSEDDRVNGTDAGASEENGNSLPCHGHIDGDRVTFLDSHTLEDVCYAANFAKELSIRDLTTITGFIGLVDDCGLFRGNP